MGTDISKIVDELDGRNRDNASCTLESLGPSVTVQLYEHYQRSVSAKIRQAIVEIIGRFRRPDDLPFFGQALQDPTESVWQAAIDGLVSQPSPVSLEILNRALESEVGSKHPNTSKVSYIEEAISELQKPNPFGIVKNETGRA